jgi:hypothetical protein
VNTSGPPPTSPAHAAVHPRRWSRTTSSTRNARTERATVVGAFRSDAAALRAARLRMQFPPGLKTRGSLQDQAETALRAHRGGT